MNLKTILSTLAVTAFAFASSVASASVVYTFDIPATGIPSIKGPYPDVATLTATNIVGGVQFDLVPNTGSYGVNPKDATKTFIQDVQFVFAGNSIGSVSDVSGAATKSVKLDKTGNMDASYKSTINDINVTFYTSKGHTLNFSSGSSSVWDIFGITTSELIGLDATANNKPSPIDAIISVTDYALCRDIKGNPCKPTPSNWVSPASPASPVPEPRTYAMWLAGLGLIRFLVYRRKNDSSNIPSNMLTAA